MRGVMQAVEGLVQCFVKYNGISDGVFLIEVAKLTYNVLTYQKASSPLTLMCSIYYCINPQVSLQSDVLIKLLHLLLSSLATTHPPNELCYASATIVNMGISHQVYILIFRMV